MRQCVSVGIVTLNVLYSAERMSSRNTCAVALSPRFRRSRLHLRCFVQHRVRVASSVAMESVSIGFVLRPQKLWNTGQSTTDTMKYHNDVIPPHKSGDVARLMVLCSKTEVDTKMSLNPFNSWGYSEGKTTV